MYIHKAFGHRFHGCKCKNCCFSADHQHTRTTWRCFDLRVSYNTTLNSFGIDRMVSMYYQMSCVKSHWKAHPNTWQTLAHLSRIWHYSQMQNKARDVCFLLNHRPFTVWDVRLNYSVQQKWPHISEKNIITILNKSVDMLKYFATNKASTFLHKLDVLVKRQDPALPTVPLYCKQS